MSTPISDWIGRRTLFAALLSVCACAQTASDLAKGETIACAVDGSADFKDVCTIERNGPRLIVRRPDGGFRQFEIRSNGTVATLDGADPAQSTVLTNGMIEARIEGDRYRFRREAPGDAAKQ